MYNPAVPFTSDEAMQEALRKADYTPKAVLLLSTELSGKAKALNAKAGSGMQFGGRYCDPIRSLNQEISTIS